MQTPLQLTGSIRSKSRVTQWTHFGVFAALAGLLFLQARLPRRIPHDGDSVSHGIAPAMQIHLNEISTALTAYMQNHDTASLERIKAEGRESSRLIEDFKKRL